MSTITFETVRGEDGLIDVSASASAARALVKAARTAEETPSAAQIEEERTMLAAIEQVFDNHSGTGLNVPFVLREALTLLNVQPHNHAVLSTRLHKLITANTQGKKNEDGSYERPNSLFVSSRGKQANGSLRRRSDLAQSA